MEFVGNIALIVAVVALCLAFLAGIALGKLSGKTSGKSTYGLPKKSITTTMVDIVWAILIKIIVVMFALGFIIVAIFLLHPDVSVQGGRDVGGILFVPIALALCMGAIGGIASLCYEVTVKIRKKAK